MNKRTCSKCNISKFTDDFYDRHKSKYKTSWCKPCILAERNRKYHENPEKQAMIARERRLRNPEKMRDVKLTQTYGLAPGVYHEMLKQQDGVCASCKKSETVLWKGKITRLCVDHDHCTKVVRGLLCAKCNKALGLLNDNPETVLMLFNYISNFRGKG